MLTFDAQGLVPAVIVDDATGMVLMVAFMNAEALQLTRTSGQTHFFSRSRNAIWHKGEQSGNFQEVRDLFINCEENSLLVRVKQHGDAACHDGYQSCYYRRLLPDDSYQTVAARIFDPALVYHTQQNEVISMEQGTSMAGKEVSPEVRQRLEDELRQLYGVYIYLRDHDLSTESNTSRLLHDRDDLSHGYLLSRLSDELQELADVQTGEHVHTGRQQDTTLEGSQVGYWLFLLASINNIPFNTFEPDVALLTGYAAGYNESRIIELRQECLSLLEVQEPVSMQQGLNLGFSIIGWACAEAGIDPLAPASFDLEQMRRKGLVS